MTFPNALVPNTFASQAGPIPLAQLDANFTSLQTAINYVAAVAKPANTARASTAALTNDPDLVYAIPSSGTYQIEVFINTSYLLTGVSNNGGLVLNLNYGGSFTSGPTTSPAVVIGGVISPASSYLGYVSQAIQASPSSSAIQLVGITSTATYYSTFKVSAVLVATGTGTLGVAWAQAVSNATATTLYAGSYMTVTRVL